MTDFVFYGGVALALVVMAYVMSRAASIAYFRTKLEYFRSVIREGGVNKPNGQE